MDLLILILFKGNVGAKMGIFTMMMANAHLVHWDPLDACNATTICLSGAKNVLLSIHLKITSVHVQMEAFHPEHRMRVFFVLSSIHSVWSALTKTSSHALFVRMVITPKKQVAFRVQMFISHVRNAKVKRSAQNVKMDSNLSMENVCARVQQLSTISLNRNVCNAHKWTITAKSVTV